MYALYNSYLFTFCIQVSILLRNQHLLHVYFPNPNKILIIKKKSPSERTDTLFISSLYVQWLPGVRFTKQVNRGMYLSSDLCLSRGELSVGVLDGGKL